MENNRFKSDEQSFLRLSQQREQSKRLKALFDNAAGEEEISLRDENVKHFNLGANRHQAVVYSEPVHFRNSESDAWQEIDNTLEETVTAQGRQVLRNRANRMQVEFPQQMDGGNMASITENGRTFAWRFEQETQPVQAVARTGAQLKQERLVARAQTMPKFVGRTVESLRSADLAAEIETAQEQRGDVAQLKAENTYESVLPGVSVRYTVMSDRVKEDIILENAEALSRAAIRLPKAFDYEVTDAMQLLVKDVQSGETAFMMDAPLVYDAKGKETLAQVILTDAGEYVRMEYAIDPLFMADAVYPVTIDPVVHSTNPVNNIQDTTLCENLTLRPYTQDHIRIGRTSGIYCVGLLKFNILAIPKACDTVVQAVLQMAVKSSSTSKYVGAYEVLKPWESASVDWTNFNPLPSAGNVSTEALECVQSKASGWLSFDLTNLYRKWCTRNAAGVSNNNGVAFRTPDNTPLTDYTELYSSDASSSYRPVMYVNYISHAGIEDWWQYEQRSAGRAGTVYTDLFNGNMVLAHSDTVMTGNRNPVSVNHYYNSCLSTANAYNCGFGWKTDAHQKVTALTLNNKKYLVWEDGDGTEHFFDWSGSQPFKDVEGMELKLTFSSDGKKIFIFDKMDNGMRFNVVQAGLAWLEATTDACGNVTTYSYVSGYESVGRLDKITDAVGRVTQFAYNANGLISSIRIPAAEDNAYRDVFYTYDSANRLTGVRYSELGGTTPHTTYAYEGSTKLLTLARNFDGVQVNVGYESTSLYGTSATDDARRVLSVETVATDASGAVVKSGAKQIFEYGAMTTEVTAVEGTASNAGKKMYYQFNDSGNVICVRDELGFAKFTKYASGIENKPSEESKLRKAVVNRLRRADFASQWTAVSAGGTAAKDASNLCLNCNSIKMTKTAAGEVIYRQPVTLEAGQPFTLSAYVKTSGLSSGGAFVRIVPAASGAFAAAISDKLTGSTDAAIGNELPTDGWERIRVTLDAQSTAVSAYAELVCDASSGTAWFACPQLETGVVANAFNLVSNGDFRHTTVSGEQTLPLDWDAGVENMTTAATGVKVPAASDNFPTALEGNYVQVEGRPNKSAVGFVQYYDMNGKQGDVFVVGGWADGKSVPNANSWDKGFTLALSLKKKSDGKWIRPAVYPFNGEWVGWQQSCYATAAGADYTQIALYLLYSGNCNHAKFTNIFLHREAYGTTFGYDDNGNVLSSSNLSGQKSKATYDSANNAITYVQPGRDDTDANRYLAYYGSTDADKKKHLPWRTRTPMQVTDYFSYDSFGNPLSSRRVNYKVFTESAAESANPYIRTENTYTSDGNYSASTKDARGNVVSQVVNQQDGTLQSVTDPTNQTVNYTYDASKRVTGVSTAAGGKTYKNAYTYENDRIKTVSHNTTGDAADVTYTFHYDELGRKTSVQVGSQTLSTNVYENDRDGQLSEVQYGNGGKVHYSYDDFDRLTGVRYDGETGDRYVYKYGANGEAAEVEDHSLGRIARTDYDQADRPCQTELRDASTGEALYKTSLKYDRLSNLEQFAEKAGGETHTSKYTYDRDNRVTEIQYDGGAQKVSYAYDAIGRVSSRVAECGADVGKLTSTYSYVDGGFGTNSTTPLVKKITQNGISFEYEYDSRGNIVSEKRGNLTTTYAYDALGQLIRVNDPHENATWVYSYDRGGNILSKVKYAYTTGTVGTALETIPYAYGDANWKDKLTAYNGTTITYDAIGNPMNDGAWTFTWAAGRQLKKMSREGQSLTFKYDHNGMRIQKVLEHDWYPETTNYTYHGKLLTHMNVTYTDFDEVEHNDRLHFFYDGFSCPAKVEFNGIMYTYVQNLQGDIVAVVDNEGNKVVEYMYDSWGKLLGTVGSLANTLGKMNPIRYRGYIYDEESNRYYVQSRYYNPDWNRMISADEQETVLASPPELTDRNVYAYCDNDPVSRDDDGGKFWNIVIGAAVGALVGAAASVISQVVTTGSVNAGSVAIAAVSGAISGGFAASGIPVKGQVIANAIIGGASSAADTYATRDENTNAWTYVKNTLIGAGIGALSGKVGGRGAGSRHLHTSAVRLEKRICKAMYGIGMTGLKAAVKEVKKSWKYYASQTTKEAVKCGKKAIGSIFLAAVPGFSYSMRKVLY